ncbi:MAG: HD domain-containing protein [Clostridia bacterium]|nr:HD domain-containing protein [Clostridia bacterium]
MKEITEQSLDGLRERVMHEMSPKRFRHTLAVEQMVERLCALFCPEESLRMRAAALLHDLTKELDTAGQTALCHQMGISLTPADLLAPKTLHARTAAARIEVDFSEFSDPVVIDAVRWHTTGRAGMTLTEKLLYLSDYIDLSRTFSNCVILRHYFFGAAPESMNGEERLALLRDTLILSYDMTIRDLLDEGIPVAEDTVMARNELLLEKAVAEGRFA